MKFWQLLLVSISVLRICQAGPNDTNLTLFIEKSARLARVSAAIAIQNGIYDPKSIIADVTAEFLNIPPSTVSELLKHDFNALAKGLQDYLNSIGKFSIKMKNPDELVKALTLFMAMKKSEKFLKKGAIQDPSKHFKDGTAVMEGTVGIGVQVLAKSNFEGAVDILRRILKEDAESVDDEERNKLLVKLLTDITAVQRQLNEMGNYKTLFKDYLGLVRLKTDLKDFTNVVSIAGEYSTTFQKIDPFRNDLKLASNDASQTKSAILDIQKYSEIVQTISTTPILNSISTEGGKKKLTSGLSQYTDLNIVFNDLTDPWFQKHVANDRDTKTIIDGLEDLKTFLTKFATISLQWKSFSENSKSREQSLALIKTISEAYESGKNALEISSTKSPFEEISTCISSMNPLAHPIDQQMFGRIVEYADLVHTNVRSFETGMEKINKNNLAVAIQNTQVLVQKLYSVAGGLDANGTISVWDSIRNLAFLEDLTNNYESTLSTLSSMNTKMFYDKGDKLNYDVISGISTVFDGTNVDTVVGCIQKSSIDNLVEVFSFVRRTQDLKAQSSEFKTATVYITSVSKVKSEYVKMEEDVKKTKLSNAAIRLRDAPEFKNIRKMSEGLGKGVYSLRALNDIKKAEKSITVVANPDVEVKKVAALVKGIDSDYNDASREKLKTVVTKMNEFEKSVPSNVTKFFEYSGKFDFGPKLDSTFSTKISMQLAGDPNPKNQALSKDFEVVGGLDLDFVKHKSSLGGMSSLFGDFEKSIRGFLATSEPSDNGENAAAEVAWYQNWVIWVIVGCVLLVVILILISCVHCYKTKTFCWHPETKLKSVKKETGETVYLTENVTKFHIPGFNPNKWRLDEQAAKEKASKIEGRKSNEKASKSNGKARKGEAAKSSSNASKANGKPGKPTWVGRVEHNIYIPPKPRPWYKFWGRKNKTADTKQKNDVNLEAGVARSPPMPPPNASREKLEAHVFSQLIKDDGKSSAERRKRGEKKTKQLAADQKRLDENKEKNNKEVGEWVQFCVNNFKGPIYIPNEPSVSPAVVLPDNIILTCVDFDPESCEMWIIGSEIDDIELDADYVMNPDSITTESEEDNEKSAKKLQSRKEAKESMKRFKEKVDQLKTAKDLSEKK